MVRQAPKKGQPVGPAAILEDLAMKLLHIDSSILGGGSASRQVSAAIVEQLAKATPGLDIIHRDLAAAPLAHLSGEHLAAAHGAVPESPVIQNDVATSQAVLEEFLAADIVVIGAPMYNFTIPSQLKAWIDRVLVAGKTFRYTANGPEGLAGDKRVILAISRGGFYGAGAPAAAYEHVETYLRTVFGFIGVTDLKIIIAEGLQIGPEQREKSMRTALQAVTELPVVTQLRAA
jgi:FMN-dependent NADH-azoreductase